LTYQKQVLLHYFVKLEKDNQMTTVIKGINTGAIKYNGQFYLMAVKIQNEDSIFSTYYMPINVIIDLLILLRSRVHLTALRVAEKGDNYKSHIIDENKKLGENMPTIDINELQQPNLNFIITSFTPKLRDESCTINMVLQNETITSLCIEDYHAEFFIFAIQQALTSIEDKETLQKIASVLDFLMLYHVDLSDLSYLNYNHISHEPWKQSMFSNYLAVLYCFEKEQSKKILAAIVIKTNILPDTAEADNLFRRIANMAPGLQALQEKDPLVQTFARIIPAQQSQVLSLNECLRPLHAFCVETLKTI